MHMSRNVEKIWGDNFSVLNPEYYATATKKRLNYFTLTLISEIWDPYFVESVAYMMIKC